MIPTSSIQYPVFKKGDTLKSDDLNNLVNYLEGEQLDTRVYLIGAGVFYGLEPQWDNNTKKLTITNGAGVSSDGFLFTANVADPNNSNALIPLRYNDLGNSTSITLADGSRIEGRLLIPGDGEGSSSLAERIALNDVVVIYARSEKITVEDCLRSYENSGERQKYTLEAMLVPIGNLDAQIAKWDPAVTSIPIAEGEPFVNRFGYFTDLQGNEFISFDGFTSWETVRNNFNNVCAAAESRIAADYIAAFDSYARLLQMGGKVNPFTGLEGKLQAARQRLNADNSPLPRQLPYYYDYLKDLVAAYQEFFRTGYLHLRAIPDEKRFEKYVALGNCGEDRAGMEKYRMKLYRPPFGDTDQELLDRLRVLMLRMEHLANPANTLFRENHNLPDTVTITPSAALSAPLSHKAIPFYYTNRTDNPATPQTPGLQHYWNYDAERQRRLFSIPGIDNATDRLLLLRDMDAYNFFRVQGHIGQKADVAQSAISAVRSQLHLPFDIKVVFLVTDAIAQEIISEETAWFTDLGLLLEKVVNDIRCENACGDDYEGKIFGPSSVNMNIGQMFEALIIFFDKVTDENWTSWVTTKCREICNNNVPADSAAVAFAGPHCCPLHLKILYDLHKEYKRRKEEALSQVFFHKFAAAHPGLEHNAGVPKGGTLVLVCADEGTFDDEQNAFLARLKSLKSLDAAAKATVIREIAVLSDYRVVADFCLPYTCCSNTPSVKLELREVQPEADFEIAEQEELPGGAGWKYTFHNLSRNANHFKWELLDADNGVLASKETPDLATPVNFDLKLEAGLEFTLQLTAHRGALSQMVAKKLYICPPQGSLKLYYKDKEKSFKWKKGTPVVDLILTAFPYGGEFYLEVSTGGNEWSFVDQEDYTITWQNGNKTVKVDYDDLEAGTYRLTYIFSDCEDASAEFEIGIEAATPPPPGNTRSAAAAEEVTAAATATDVNKLFNQRAGQYRKAVAAVGDEDKTMSKTEKFGKTEAFLRFSGKQAELHNRYADLLKSLQTGMTNAGEKRQQQVADLVTYSTLYYLDRLLAGTPDAVPEEARSLLQEAAAVVKEQPAGLKRLQELWDATAVTNEQNSASINAYKALLR
jgi:hypothetical protein